MGCHCSKLNDSEVVRRCLDRKRLLRRAMRYQQDFAYAHLAYIRSLQDVGQALCSCSEGQLSVSQIPPKNPPLVVTPGDVQSLPVSAIPAAVIAPHVISPNDISSSLPTHTRADHTEAERVLADQDLGLDGLSSPSYSISNDDHVFHDIYNFNSYGTPSQPIYRSLYSPYFGSPITGTVNNGSPMASHSASKPLYYNPSLLSSPPTAPWDPFNFFNPPLIPLYSRGVTVNIPVQNSEQDEEESLFQLMQEEGLPKLEEEQHADQERHQLVEDDRLKLQKAMNPKAEVMDNSLHQVVENKKLVEETQETDDKEDLSTWVTLKSKLVELMRNLNYQFMKASESGYELKILFETELFSPDVSTLKLESDSTSFNNAISVHWSHTTSLYLKDIDGADTLMNGSSFSHPSTLEKLYSWEKRLYKELKAGEQLQAAFAREKKRLISLHAEGGDPNLIEKTTMAMRSLDSHMLVAVTAASSISTRIQQLTSEQLYPQLVNLLRSLSHMWRVMSECHEAQRRVALEIETIDDKLGTVYADDEAHMHAITELEYELKKWHSHLHLWVTSQKHYLDVMLEWIKICLMEPEIHVNVEDSFLDHSKQQSPTYLLIKSWHAALTSLVEHMQTLEIIEYFAGVIHAQLVKNEESNQRLAESFRKESSYRTHLLKKHNLKMKGKDDLIAAKKTFQRKEGLLGNSIRSPLKSHENVINSLRENLSPMFEALSAFAAVAHAGYEKSLKVTNSFT